nr:MAG TPA: hypothetical protein [Caudoviricetes sp.]
MKPTAAIHHKGRLKIFRRPLFYYQHQITPFNAIYELIPTAPLLSISPSLPTTVSRRRLLHFVTSTFALDTF